MKFLILLILFTNFQLSNLKRAQKVSNFKFKNIKCDFSERAFSEFVYENATCFAKTWNKKETTLFADIVYKVPISQFFVSFPIKDIH